jgi:cyclophilin family peptidyl-prolyl cis-trans isomerase
VELLGLLNAPASLEKLRALLSSDDLIIAVAAASSLAHLDDKAAIPSIRQLMGRVAGLADVAPPVAEALAILDAKEALPDLREWLGSPDFAVRTAAADAITRLEGAPLFAKNVEFSESSVSHLPLLAKGARLAVTTPKGAFEISLFTDDAPITAANLAALAKRGYFRNLTFHRVVPDFVVQGGDPRGDGNGGPGYTIRCEVNHHTYKRYVVGMALSGRDTGGSQFFVTTSAQPHLDARYTAFGEVTSGQGVIDQLLEGDEITGLRVIEP